MTQGLARGPGMPVGVRQMETGGSWWLPCHGTCGSCLGPGLLYTPFPQRIVTSYIAEPMNPFSSIPTHQTHCSSRRPGARDIAHLFSKASHAQTRRNMKGRRKGQGASGWVSGLSHRALSVTNSAVGAIASTVQLYKPRPASRTFLGGKLRQRRKESWRVRLAPVSFLTGPWVGNVAFLAPGLDELTPQTSFFFSGHRHYLVISCTLSPPSLSVNLPL